MAVGKRFNETFRYEPIKNRFGESVSSYGTKDAELTWTGHIANYENILGLASGGLLCFDALTERSWQGKIGNMNNVNRTFFILRKLRLTVEINAFMLIPKK